MTMKTYLFVLFTSAIVAFISTDGDIQFTTNNGLYMLEGKRVVVGAEIYSNGSGYSEITSDRVPFDFYVAAEAMSEWRTKYERRRAANLTEELLENFDFSKALINITELKTAYVLLPPLPESSQIERLTIHSGTLPKEIGACSKLTYLRIIRGIFDLISDDWLANCSQLRTLELQEFYLSEGKVRVLLDSAAQLQELLLSAVNDLHRIVEFTLFPLARGREKSIQKLLILGVLDNNAANESAALTSQMSLLPYLQELDVSSIAKLDICAKGFPPVTFTSLELLHLQMTSTNRVCFKEYRAMPKLKHLDLQETTLSTLDLGELFVGSKPYLHVNLQGTALQYINVEREDYNRLGQGSSKGNITLTGLNLLIDCDCNNAYLWMAMYEKTLITSEKIECDNGLIRSVSDARNQLECDRFNCGPCTCRRYWETNELSADCSKLGLTEFPPDVLHLKELKNFLGANNNLSSIPEDLPSTIINLDLTNNDIGQLSTSETAVLFTVPQRRIRLADNPITCSCDNKFLLDALYDHRSQVEDYNNIRCVGTSTLLHTVDTTYICKDRNLVTAGTAIFAALLVAALMSSLGITVYYRRNIKIYLFARGLCLWWVREDDLDSDRVYDVFLSFCHTDEKIVIEELLPMLDRDYRVCVHFRDWVPGELIPTQIVRSVEISRKTIIVLSRSFVNSIWGLLEFRTAHLIALHEERARVIIIILDDVLETNLDSELKGYLRTNTYVKWGDPWLWDKLRYALPHRTIESERPNTTVFVNEAHVNELTDSHYND